MLADADELAPNTRPGMGFALMLFASLSAVFVLMVARSLAEPRAVPADIRFCNATSDTLGRFASGGGRFGDIAPGQCSNYVRVTHGHVKMGFSAEVRGRHIDVRLEDYLGDPALPAGRHTPVVRDTAGGPSAQLDTTSSGD